MTISSVASSAYSASAGSFHTNQLDAQIQSLQQQVKDENQNKTDDAQTQQQKIQLLEQQIQLIEMQIQQAKNNAANSHTESQDTPVPASIPSSVGQFLDIKA